MKSGGKEYLVGDRGERKKKGEMGGRRHTSGGGALSDSERGKKKGEAGSQHSRMNPPERVKERGSKAAMRRAMGYGSGRYQGD